MSNRELKELVKELCDCGLCVSMAQARRMVHMMSPELIKQQIERKKQRGKK